MKKIMAILSVLFLLLPMIAMAEEIIKIGVLAYPENPKGMAIRQAVGMAAEEINSNGGIPGKKIALVFADTKLKPAIAAYEYTRLADQEKVSAVIGAMSSEEVLAIAEQVPKYKVLFLPTGSASPEVTDKIRQNYDSLKYIFRIFHDSHELADFSSEWIVEEIVKKRGLKNIALMIENAVWSRAIASKYEKDIKSAGANVSVSEYFYTETKDFKPIFSKMSNCEAVCVLSAHVDASEYIKQWADVKGPLMIGITGTFATAWKDTEGKALSLISMSFPGIFGVNAGDKAFHDKYIEKYKVIPEYTAPYSYDALYILKTAIERANSAESGALVDAMEKTDYNGIMGRWVFDKASHHPKFGSEYRQFLMAQWHPRGKVCMLWPETSKTCDMILPSWK